MNHHGLRALVAVAALTAAAQASAELLLYERPNFNGRSVSVEGEESNLRREDFNDRASSAVVRRGRWELCSDANFRGQCVTLGPGNYRSLRDMGLNNAVSSAREVGRGHGGGGGGNWGGGRGDAIELYEHDNLRGERITSNGAMPNLGHQGFNDRVSSVVVRRGQWELCDDANFRGRCVTIGPGTYDNLRQIGLNDRVSSIRPSGSGGGGGNWGDGGGQRPPGQIGAPPPVVDHTPPHVTMGPDRTGEVSFRDGCVAYYDHTGRRFRTVGPCQAGQLTQADEAMIRRRDQDVGR